MLRRITAALEPLAYAPPSLCTIDGGGEGADGGGGLPAAPPPSDEANAAGAIEGLLGASGDDGDNESDANASDPGARESEPTGDEDEGQPEPQGEKPAAIVPPASWSAEDKALFSKLPPEAQAVVARRESERDRVVNQRTEEIAQERKGWDAERRAISTERQGYLQSLQQMVHLALPEAKAFEGVDWAKLAAENPAEYVRLTGMREQLRGRIGALQQEIGRVTQQQTAEQQQLFQRRRADEQQLLVSKVPDFGDAEKGPKLAADLRGWLSKEGFDEREIGTAIDHRLLAMAVKAMRYDVAEAARASSVTKKANPPPTVQKPGSAPAPDAPGRRVQQKIQQLGRTNSVRDAAALLEEFIA
jgi:hypothetical protein